MSEKLEQKLPEISPELEQQLRSKIDVWLPELAEILPGVSLET